MTGKTVLPIIRAQAEAQEEVNQLNVINQLVIGTKEGIVQAITKLVGSNVTDDILWTSNGSNHKSINKFKLHKVMTNGVLEQLLKVINQNFDFRKKVGINMELMQSNAVQIATYGIVIGIPQLTLTLLAIKMAPKSDYGSEFCLAMHAKQKEIHVQPRT